MSTPKKIKEKRELDLEEERGILEKIITLCQRRKRRPLREFVALSRSVGDDELTVVIEFLHNLYCQIYNISEESANERDNWLKTQFFQEISKGKTVEEVKDIFIKNVFLVENQELSREFFPEVETGRNLSENAKFIIEKNFKGRISLNSVARKLNVSKEHLSRVFKKKYKVTITEYIHKIRIERARKIMNSRESSLKQVCYDVGYQSYNDFYRNFRKIIGVSPKDYQKNPDTSTD